jgi:hypothetical protein
MPTCACFLYLSFYRFFVMELNCNYYWMLSFQHSTTLLGDCYSFRNSSHLGSFLDPAFMSLIKDPDLRRKEQWEKTAQAQRGWNCAKMLGFGDLGGPPLSAAEEYSLHSRYLAKANSLNLSEIAEMKIV